MGRYTSRQVNQWSKFLLATRMYIMGIPFCHYRFAFDRKTEYPRYDFIEKHKCQMDHLEHPALREQWDYFIFSVG